MPLFIMMLLAGIGNGVGDFFTKFAAGKISPYLSALTLSLGTMIPVGIYLLIVSGQQGNLQISKVGFIYSLLGGISIGVGMIFFFTLFAKGASISVAQPIIKSVVVLSAVLLGIIVLREKVTTTQIVGMVLSLAGIYFLTK